ncbi:MAG: sigma-70 family RNA polymerase sigma factor [Chloroflexia bacterium]|nr:sigma-70 family RNA polymerase sigma factor [Chloroflexia bacterium]
MEQSDEALIQACRRGDAAAWETLINRYQRLIFSIPRRSGLNEDLAAEVFQHVFTTLVEQLPNIEQPQRIKAWLVTTARRETWRVSRGERASQATAGNGDWEDNAVTLQDNDPLPEETIVRLEEQHTVYTAVSGLDDRCRQLLTMLFYDRDRLPYADIAATLGTSEGSIGPTRARCLEKLRRALSDLGYYAVPVIQWEHDVFLRSAAALL